MLMKRLWRVLIVWCVAAMAAGCTPAAPEPSSTPAGTLPPPIDSSARQPEGLTFSSTDGTTLAATFWPPATAKAPGVILMHMRGSSQSAWADFAGVLQGSASRSSGTTNTTSYAVLTFDFRGHGASGGSASDHAGTIEDAGSALRYLRSRPEVDPNRIVLIGASIGGDAAVDACDEGCVGAVSLSPGGFLGIAYNTALGQMSGKPVLCVAAEGDTPSAVTCQNGSSAGLAGYQARIYTGTAAHGTILLAAATNPPLSDLLLDWLQQHVPPQ